MVYSRSWQEQLGTRRRTIPSTNTGSKPESIQHESMNGRVGDAIKQLEDSVAGAEANTPERSHDSFLSYQPYISGERCQSTINHQANAKNYQPLRSNWSPQPHSSQQGEPVTHRTPIQPLRIINPTMGKTKTSVRSNVGWI